MVRHVGKLARKRRQTTTTHGPPVHGRDTHIIAFCPHRAWMDFETFRNSSCALAPTPHYFDGLEIDAVIELRDGRWAPIEIKLG